MGREVRSVPEDWQHPKKENGEYRPLLPASWDDAFKEWMTGWKNWQKGLRRDWGTDELEPIDDKDKSTTYSDYSGNIPNPDDYMPEWSDAERTHIQMYEDTTEGTPISPVMKTPEELARWLVDNNASAFGGQTASYEGWLRVAQGGFAPSFVVSNEGIQSGVDAL